jgi:hypothetical protein
MHRSTMAHWRSGRLKCADMASTPFFWLYTRTTVIVARRRTFIVIAGPTTARKLAREVMEAGYTASMRQSSATSAQRFGRISRNAMRTSIGPDTMEKTRRGSKRIRS